MARTSRRVARRGGVSAADEPSAEWGWSGTFPNATRIAGVVVAIILLVLLLGPYQSHLQDFWMIPIALGLVAMVARGIIKRRNAWRE